MFDGIDAGKNRVLNSASTVGVSGNFAAQPVRGIDDGLHLFRAVLRQRGIVSFRKHPSGGHKFDYVGAIFYIFANFFGDGIDAVGHAVRRPIKLRRKEIFIAVAAGDAERRAGYEHARAGHIAGLDGVTQRDIGVSARSHIAHGGETSFESDASVAGAGERLARIRKMQARWARIAGASW